MNHELDVLAAEVVKVLRAGGFRLGTAESCTGGMILDVITQVPGASEVLWGGIVAYQDEAKTALLNVTPELLRTHGAVSAETANAMALGGLHHISAAHPGAKAICIATTGIAGPGGGTSEKPVGLCHIGLASTETTTSDLRVVSPDSFDRLQNKLFFTRKALEFTLSALGKTVAG